MKKLIHTFAIMLAAAVAVLAQTNTAPSPTPTPDDSDVVKISTSLIQFDLSATDKKGKVVTDLKPDEVEIYENGQKQKVTNFSFISSVRETVEKPVVTAKGDVPLPPTVLRPDKVRRTVALVVDDLTLSFESAYQTRRALKKFVDEQMQDGDLVAIIRTGAGIGALQQFTSDKRILYAAIERVKWNPLGNGGVSAFAPMQSVDATEPADPADASAAGERTAEGSAREFNDFRESYFASGTLGAVNFLIRGMSELPGRKSIILFSDGFSLTNTDAEGFSEGSTILDSLKQLVDIANRASVVIYAVDPRGLVYTGLSAGDNTGGRTADQVASELSDRQTKLSDTQDGLRYLSDETGGFAIVNSNDISGGVKRVLDDQSYYLIAYEPDADTFDPSKRKFNKLTVKITRPGVTARYRSGFFNVADRETPSVPVKLTRVQELQNALTSPFAVSGVSLRLNALFGNDPVKGSFVRSLLHVDSKGIKLVDEKDGVKKATFDILAASFGDNGQIVDQIGKAYTLTIPAASLKRFLDDGFVYEFTFPVKKPGAYQYRVALRDEQGDGVGSASQFIEVPDVKKNRLTVSSIVIENLSVDEWHRMTAPGSTARTTNSASDTALRRARVGSILRYGFEVYNARIAASKTTGLQVRIRVFRDGQLVLDGKNSPLELNDQPDLKRIKYSGALSLGGKLVAGDYVLQAVVTDTLAKDRIATQSVQFEVVE
ncbi:MAG: VWA domain-containing protein [Acidobacteriota bacterium]